MESPQHSANNFDALRLVATSMVMVAHQYALTFYPAPAPYGVYESGSWGVAVFFTISGFLVARSWAADPQLGRFAARRMLRVWPALAVSIAITALLLGPALSSLPLRDYLRDPLVPRFFKALYFDFQSNLPMQFEGSKLPALINASLWTITIEMACYAGLAIAGMLGMFKPRLLLPVAWLVIILAYAGYEPRGAHFERIFGWEGMSKLTFEYCLFFVGGASYHLLGLEQPQQRWKAAVACLVLCVVAWWCSRYFLALLLAMPFMLLAFGQSSTPLLRHAAGWGDLSYGMYIYAFPVQQTLVHFNQGRVHWIVMLLASMLVTAGLALLSWHLVEKRALRLKPGRTRLTRPAPLVRTA